MLTIVHSACAGLHRFWNGTLSKHGTVIEAIEETLTSAAPDSVLDGVLPQLLTVNAAGFTDFLQRLREAVRPNWYRADHMIECDMIGVLLMIRLIYLLRIDGAIEVTACGS